VRNGSTGLILDAAENRPAKFLRAADRGGQDCERRETHPDERTPITCMTQRHLQTV